MSRDSIAMCICFTVGIAEGYGLVRAWWGALLGAAAFCVGVWFAERRGL